MKPQAAVTLTAQNPILTSSNIELGVMTADNDSSAICAARNANTHEIFKQSETNHTSKGLTNELYKIDQFLLPFFYQFFGEEFK